MCTRLAAAGHSCLVVSPVSEDRRTIRNGVGRRKDLVRRRDVLARSEIGNFAPTVLVSSEDASHVPPGAQAAPRLIYLAHTPQPFRPASWNSDPQAAAIGGRVRLWSWQRMQGYVRRHLGREAIVIIHRFTAVPFARFGSLMRAGSSYQSCVVKGIGIFRPARAFPQFPLPRLKDGARLARPARTRRRAQRHCSRQRRRYRRGACPNLNTARPSPVVRGFG